MLHFLKTHYLLSAFLLIILGGGGYYVLSDQKGPEFRTVLVKRGNLVQEVTFTGTVTAKEEVNLSFEKTGKVHSVLVKTGTFVKPGQMLAELDSLELEIEQRQIEAKIDQVKEQKKELEALVDASDAQLKSAKALKEKEEATMKQLKAALKAEEAKLTQLKKGSRVEEISLQETKVESAKKSLLEAEKNMLDKIKDAYTKSDNAVRNQSNQIFNGPYDYTLRIFVPDPQLQIDIKSDRESLERLFADWKEDLKTISEENVFSHVSLAKKNLTQIQAFLEKAAKAINFGYAPYGTSQSTFDSWKVDVFSARSNVNTALANLVAAEEKITTASSTITLEEKQLSVLKAGTEEEQILAQEALVEQAQASIEGSLAVIKQTEASILNAKAGSLQARSKRDAQESIITQSETELDLLKTEQEKNILRSPLTGVVTKNEVKVGEIVSPGTPLLSIISASLQIEANVPEADIAKIHLKDQAELSLDAYGEDLVFLSLITTIDPAETIIDGVATYKTIFAFLKTDTRIKSGMTANIDVVSEKKENVLFIPQRAIEISNREKFVRVETGKKEEPEEERKIETGLRASDGTIEVILGLSEGERVILPSIAE